MNLAGVPQIFVLVGLVGCGGTTTTGSSCSGPLSPPLGSALRFPCLLASGSGGECATVNVPIAFKRKNPR